MTNHEKQQRVERRSERDYSDAICHIWGVEPINERGYPIVQVFAPARGEQRATYHAYHGEYGIYGNDRDGWRVVYALDGAEVDDDKYDNIKDAACVAGSLQIKHEEANPS